MLVGTYFVWKELERAWMVREQPEVCKKIH